MQLKTPTCNTIIQKLCLKHDRGGHYFDKKSQSSGPDMLQMGRN